MGFSREIIEKDAKTEFITKHFSLPQKFLTLLGFSNISRMDP